MWGDGLMYNGIPASAVTSRGARKLGIEKIPPIVTRGVDAAGPSPRTAAEPIHIGAHSAVEIGDGDQVPGGGQHLARVYNYWPDRGFL